MKSLFHLLLPALLASAALPAAEVPTSPPKKTSLTQYAPLWNRSPFTTPPVPVAVETGPGPFDDLALRGIAQLTTGHYLITLTHKKEPDKTQVIDTERNPEYEVLKVERDPDNLLGTVVTLKKGSITGTVSYDEKISSAPKIAVVAPKPGQPGQPGQPPQIPGRPPGVVPQPNLPPGVRQPRQRVVMPTPGAAPAAAPQAPGGRTSGGRPDFRGGNSGGGRPDFRGGNSRAPRR